uniref:alkaline phosphatase family protein n=1 Tax=Haliangium sp. TaxID=2663208 RepID=UPI003D0F1D34
ALRLTPAGDELFMVTARAAIDALGLGTGPVSDFLALSFSAHDYASHYWGQESWERLDLVVRLDRALGEFMDELDRRLGPDGYALLLTSDHGTTRLVERSRAAGRLARRIAVDEIERAAAAAATTALGPGEWVAAGSRATLHLGADFDALPAATRESALDAVVAAVAAIDGIQYAARVDRIAGGCDRRAGLEALACRSLVPGASGHVYFAAAPDSVITEHPAGTGHGSPNPDDRTVPIFVYAPAHPRWARARVERRPVSLLQVAPTLATLLGVPAPPAATAPPLP